MRLGNWPMGFVVWAIIVVFMNSNGIGRIHLLPVGYRWQIFCLMTQKSKTNLNYRVFPLLHKGGKLYIFTLERCERFISNMIKLKHYSSLQSYVIIYVSKCKNVKKCAKENDLNGQFYVIIHAEKFVPINSFTSHWHQISNDYKVFNINFSVELSMIKFYHVLLRICFRPQRSSGKVMFSQVSVILLKCVLSVYPSMHWGRHPLLHGKTTPEQTPPPPWADTP